MTITYTGEVATCRGFGCFLKLLLRWRGSIYKLVWLDLLTFLFLYYLLNLVYRFALTPQHKLIFEGIVQYCYNYSDLIPLSFVLGFYVSIVMTRWWNQYISIPWPDPIAVFVSANVHGQDERGRVMRRTIMRYVCLCLTMVLTNISPRVKKRFPNLNNFVEAGLLNDNEKAIIDVMNKGFPRHSKHWLPIVWAASIVTRARKEGRIRDDFAVKTIIDELNKFRGQCGLLISYDTISVPLVYTQVVTLAVYSYFLCSVMGQQWIEGKLVANSTYINKIDFYFPVFTTLQFFFYMGWLKVAESLINPFGEDDDDFEVNWMVDRNLQISYLIVDEMHHDHPELLKDQYWDEVFPNELPYTIATERFREEHPEPSTAKIEVPKAEAISTGLSAIHIDDATVRNIELKPSLASEQSVISYKFPDNVNTQEEADDASGIHFIAGSGKSRQSSSPSLVSLSGTLSRVNTVASVLKRLLSKEDSHASATTPSEETQKSRIPGNISAASLSESGVIAPSTYVNKIVGSMRIADQVIEEVDEQTTITSQRGSDINHPRLYDIFNQTADRIMSDPTSYPSNNKTYMRTQSNVETNLFQPDIDNLLSSSAPTRGSPVVEAFSISAWPHKKSASNSSNQLEKVLQEKYEKKTSNDGIGTTDDDFEKLRAEREKERQERQKHKLARSISTTPIDINCTASLDPTLITIDAIQTPLSLPSNVVTNTQDITSSITTTTQMTDKATDMDIDQIL